MVHQTPRRGELYELKYCTRDSENNKSNYWFLPFIVNAPSYAADTVYKLLQVYDNILWRMGYSSLGCELSASYLFLAFSYLPVTSGIL